MSTFESYTGPDRRKHPRHKYVCQIWSARYQPRLSPSDMIEGRLLNISLEGACISIDAPFNIDSGIIIHIKLEGWNSFYNKIFPEMNLAQNDLLKLCATVRYCILQPDDTYKIGVYFSGIRAQDKEVLKTYIVEKIDWNCI